MRAHRGAVTAVLGSILLWGCGGGEEPVSAPSAASDPFRVQAEEVGLTFEHVTGATGEYLLPEIMGAGAGLLDYDLDGDLDAFLVQSGDLLDSGNHTSRLFRSELVERGRLSFVDVTREAGVGRTGYGMGVAVGDIDNDGDPDLYVTAYGPNVLYRNEGGGRFVDVTAEAAVDDPRWSTSAAFCDLDLDGLLDLFVANYVAFDPASNVECKGSTGRRDYCTPQQFPPVADSVFRNEGGGRFEAMSAEAGIAALQAPGLGVTCADFDGDGAIDVYVANDRTENHLWVNLGNWQFRNGAVAMGAAYNADGAPEASMGVTAGDFDGDGDEDLFMTHYDPETNTLYLNDGGGNFFDATDRYGLGLVSLSYTGWGTEWFDYDNDGWLDLFVANGGVVAVETRIGRSSRPYEQRNQLFRQRAGRFEVTALDGDLPENSRGAAFGDVDDDGDVDILLANNEGPARLLLNAQTGGHHWLAVRLVGRTSNRDGIGARVAVLRAGQPALWRRVHSDGSYLSASDARAHVGLGDDGPSVDVLVAWPGRGCERWVGLAVNRSVTLSEGTGAAADGSACGRKGAGTPAPVSPGDFD